MHYNSTYAATEAIFLSSPVRCSETHPGPASSPTWPSPVPHTQWIIQLRDQDLKYAIDPNDNVFLCPMRDRSIVLWIEPWQQFYSSTTCNHLILYLILTGVRTALLSDQISLCHGLKCERGKKNRWLNGTYPKHFRMMIIVLCQLGDFIWKVL